MKHLTDGKAFAVLQQIGTAFFLPVSILPGAGLLLGIGASFTNMNTISAYGLESLLGAGTPLNSLLLIMAQVGSTIFGNLPIIFAMAVALGLAKQEKAVAVLTAGISFFVMNAAINTMLKISGQILPDGSVAQGVMAGAIVNVCGIESLQMGVFGGILTGVVAAVINNRFYKQQLPSMFSFFAGVRFVPLLAMLVFVFVGIAAFFIWPHIQNIIFSIGDIVLATSYLGTFVFGFIERLLIPFGLHHVFYIPFWQTGMGGSAIVDGVRVLGAQNIFFAELASPNTTTFSVEACRFMTGKYAFMLAGLPGAALAMYHCAKPEKRKVVGGLLLSAALTSFFTGITEPIEFTFLFIAPALYLLHCVLAGFSFLLMHVLEICIGTTFSCGFIDFTLYGLLQGTAKTNWPMLLPVLAGYFLLYYALFKFVILKFNLPTPGRGEDDEEVKLYSKKDYKDKQKNSTAMKADGSHVDDLTLNITKALGGKTNLVEINCCATRLRLTLKNMDLVNEAALKSTGAVGIIRRGNGIQIIYGPKVSTIKSNLEEYVAMADDDEQEIEVAAVVEPSSNESSAETLLNNTEHEFYAPLSGTVHPITEAPDEAFANKMMGDGFFIAPKDGKVFSPCDGEVMFVFDTKHALGIRMSTGVEFLIHYGIDTVNLNGKGFEIFVEEGQQVKKGDLLMQVDLDYVKANAKSSVCLVVFTSGQNVKLVKTYNVKALDVIASY